jgi:hypothetical protein
MFDAPGKATGWGIVGCVICAAVPELGVKGQIIATIITALLGCFNP